MHIKRLDSAKTAEGKKQGMRLASIVCTICPNKRIVIKQQ